MFVSKSVDAALRTRGFVGDPEKAKKIAEFCIRAISRHILVPSRESVGSNIVNSRPVSNLHVWELSEKLGPSHLAGDDAKMQVREAGASHTG